WRVDHEKYLHWCWSADGTPVKVDRWQFQLWRWWRRRRRFHFHEADTRESPARDDHSFRVADSDLAPLRSLCGRGVEEPNVAAAAWFQLCLPASVACDA